VKPADFESMVDGLASHARGGELSGGYDAVLSPGELGETGSRRVERSAWTVALARMIGRFTPLTGVL
jgi:hypothetical protein